MDNQRNNFFDVRTIVAIVLVAVSWLWWNNHMQTKYPEAYKKKTTNVTSSDSDSTKSAASLEQQKNNKDSLPEAKEIKEETQIVKESAETTLKIENENWSFEISSKGMGLKNIILNQYKDRESGQKEIGVSKGKLSFETQLLGQNQVLNFALTKSNENTVLGEAQLGEMKVVKTMIFDPANYTIDTKVEVQQINEAFTGLSTYIVDRADVIEETSMLSMFGGQDMFLESDDDTERITFGDIKEAKQGYFSNARIVSLNTQYFTMAMVDESSVKAEISYVFDPISENVIAELKHKVLNRNTNYQTHEKMYVGPKIIKNLKKLDPSLADVIDFGWFHTIAVYLFKVLEFFYSLLGNWGFAIIALTFLVRMIILPLHIKSHKSMKSMQEVQPLIKAAKEKHKDDPQKMNMEVMQIMKNNNANPIKGCLPMFLQFPVFIALYRLLGQSIELYQAPFIFWISDLSLKDPYYVLPVLMGVAMFFQMKITPTTGDPMQKKIMMFMPLVFSFFMMSLPSGLTLYMTVSALFTVLQYILFLREKKTI